jgi:DNA-binding NtrC family response regulator
MNVATDENLDAQSGLTLEELERDHMRRILREVKGDKVRAAQMLGIHLSTLYRKMSRYHLEHEGIPSGV